MNTEDQLLKDHVSLGATLLDRAEPEWAAMVDVDGLNLNETDLCILGQIFGTYDKGLQALNMAEGTSAALHGFNLHETLVSQDNDDLWNTYMKKLAEFWKEEIKSRLCESLQDDKVLEKAGV